MTDNETRSITVLNSWKLSISRFDKTLGDLTDDELQHQIAPGKNRVLYLLGHLTAVHDRMIPLLCLGERLHPELDDAYITNPDRVLGDPLSAIELRRAWAEAIRNSLLPSRNSPCKTGYRSMGQFPTMNFPNIHRATGLPS